VQSKSTESDYKIVVTEDDVRMRELIANVLEPLGEVLTAADTEQAKAILDEEEIAVVVTDLRMPGPDGLQVLSYAKTHYPATQVVLVTGYATVESAIDAFKSGAFDYIRKPFDNLELRYTVERALEHYRLGQENRRLRLQNRIYTEGGGLIGQSQGMLRVQKTIDAAAAYDCSVLITGESGCGKEVVARQVHMQSQRNERPFVAINCAAIPEHLIESELFGYRKGAFTGAERNKPGLFETADGGTLFLDEINNASLSLQAKLLRVLEDGVFYPTGATEPHSADVRILAASNRSMAELIASGQFREDLYYRLMVVEIAVPPLRERRTDVPVLGYFFLNKFSSQYKKPVKSLSTEVLAALLRHDWPGNVRELEHLIQRMVILCESAEVGADLLPLSLSDASEPANEGQAAIPPQSLEELEIWFIRKILRETQGDRGLAAEILGIDKSTLWRKIKRHGMEV